MTFRREIPLYIERAPRATMIPDRTCQDISRILTTAPCSREEGAPRGKQTEADRHQLLQQSLAQVES